VSSHDLLASLASAAPLAAVLDVVRGAIMVLFILISFLVILVVLAQEGKGGGLAGAFGGAGADAFGVKAGTVNKFTAWLAGLFLGLALLHAGLSTATNDLGTLDTSGYEAPADGKGGEKGPAVEPKGGEPKGDLPPGDGDGEK
jgi:preprotein translocase subunit SecG